MAASKKAQKIVRGYSVICTVAVSVWLVFVSAKLITMTGAFISHVLHTVQNSIPVLG